MCQTLTRDSGVTLEERLTFHHSLIDSEGCTYILYDSTYIYRNSWGSWYLTTNHGINQLLLTALWITLFQRNDLYFVV